MNECRPVIMARYHVPTRDGPRTRTGSGARSIVAGTAFVSGGEGIGAGLLAHPAIRTISTMQ